MEKLVRDRIPEVMRAAEKRPNFRIALTNERLLPLFAKCQEEIQEFQADRSAEELADVVEVLRAIPMELDTSDKRLEACRSRKVAVHSTFREGIVLSL